jgi:hypothetical protein
MSLVEKGEARDLAEIVLAALRNESYDALVGRYLGNPERRELSGASGATYQVEIEGFWDRGTPGDLRVMVAIDDGGSRAFSPLCTDFIMAADGTFVGE